MKYTTLRIGKLASSKQILGAAVAAVLLTVIFVPFQTARAFEVDLDLPNVDDVDQVPTSAVGSKFEVIIDVEAGELISIDSIELILDNDESSVKRAIFNSAGQRISGSPTLARGNIDIDFPSSLTNGYGYGVGVTSDGTDFVPNYSYAFNYANAFISGNAGGYSNAIGDQVNGLIGPGTITISGKLNTALMESDVSHTLDVLIDTGTGINPDHLVAPQLVFTTLGNSAVQKVSVSTGSNVDATQNIPGLGQLKVKFSQVLGGGELVIDKRGPGAIRQAVLDALGIDIFDSVSGGDGKFQFGTDSGTTIGDVFDIDASSIEINSGGNYELTVPYDQDELPDDLDEDDIKLFHFNVDTEVWEDITTDVDTTANTVTGETDSLSPVAIGYDEDDISVSSGSGGGRGGGGGGSRSVIITWPPIDTLPADHFVNFPLQRIQIASSAFLNAQGLSIAEARVNQQVSISGEFTNYQETEQDYAFIVQVTDQNGFATDIAWQQGTLESGSTAEVSTLWTPEAEGTYSIQIFVWNGISATPEPLSEVTVQNVPVSSA